MVASSVGLLAEMRTVVMRASSKVVRMELQRVPSMGAKKAHEMALTTVVNLVISTDET